MNERLEENERRMKVNERRKGKKVEKMMILLKESERVQEHKKMNKSWMKENGRRYE